MKLKFWQRQSQEKKRAYTPHKAISKAINRVEALKSFLGKKQCPICKSNGDFKLVTYEVGLEGWEVRFICNKCKTAVIINHTGFSFQFGSK